MFDNYILVGAVLPAALVKFSTSELIYALYNSVDMSCIENLSSYNFCTSVFSMLSHVVF